MRVGYPVAAALTPFLAKRLGWRAVPYCLGLPMAAFGLAWGSFATEHPAQTSLPPPIDVVQSEENLNSSSAPIQKKMEWKIFTVPAVLALLGAHVASNNLLYCFLQWTPTYYTQVLKLSDVAAGAFIAFPSTIGTWLPFLVGALENKLRAGGMPLLMIRKRMTLLGSILQAISAVCFPLAPNAVLACAANSGIQIGLAIHGSGWSPNYYEVGGKDTALMYGVGNAAASIPGMVLPPLGLLLMRLSRGSWLPLFGFCAAVTAATGALFHQYAECTTGRELLQRRAATEFDPKDR